MIVFKTSESQRDYYGCVLKGRVESGKAGKVDFNAADFASPILAD